MIDLSGRVVIVTGGNSGIELDSRLGATAIDARCEVSDEDRVAPRSSRFGTADCGSQHYSKFGSKTLWLPRQDSNLEPAG